MFRKYGTRLIGGALATATAGVSVIAYYDEGTRRSLQFWGNIFPVYVQYRAVQFLNRDTGMISDSVAETIYESMHERFTNHVQAVTYSMRGFYLKQAQLLSTRDEFVPKAYMRWVKDTQSCVPSLMTDAEAKAYVTHLFKDELDACFDEVFYEWEEAPLGVASIGQVHRCKLRATGEAVVIKFQLPGMEKRFRSDINTLKSFCALAMPQHVTAFAEIEKQFVTEFDYRGEALNLDTVRNNVLPLWSHAVNIPKPHLDLCSTHLLTMEYMEGPRLVDGIKDYYKKVSEALGKSFEQLEEEQKEAMRNGTLQYKTLAESKRVASFIQMWIFLRDVFFSLNPLRFLYNTSPLRLVTGPVKYAWSDTPLNLGDILETLCRVHASEIFRDGFFNGDCHPGNILLLKDGRLGLIDYGQVKRLGVSERITYAKLILALAKDDKKEIVRLHFDEIGTKTKHRKEDIGYLMSCFYNDRDSADVCGDKNIGSFIDWLEAEDPMVQLPEAFIFCSRVSIMMRGMGNAFGLKMRVSKLWEDEARAFLLSQGVAL